MAVAYDVLEGHPDPQEDLRNATELSQLQCSSKERIFLKYKIYTKWEHVMEIDFKTNLTSTIYVHLQEEKKYKFSFKIYLLYVFAFP